MTRSTVLEVLREDYIRTAWAKGLRERAVVIRHALKNAMLPVITLVGTEFAFLIGGLVVTETVFTLNGVGRFVVDAVAHRDYPVVQALVFLIALLLRDRQPPRSTSPTRGSTRASGTARRWPSDQLARRAPPPPRRWRPGSRWREQVSSFVRSQAARRGGRAHHPGHAASWPSSPTRSRPTTRTRPTTAPSSRARARTHWFGTDEFGRDVLSRIMYGARIALFVGFAASFAGCTLGALLGVVSAYCGRQGRPAPRAADGRPARLPAADPGPRRRLDPGPGGARTW